MLARISSAAVLAERLETHYLSNPDPSLRFALLTDFTDAPSETMPQDDEMVRDALERIRGLNDRYRDGEIGPDRFFLFHRRRLWNAVAGLLDGLGAEARQAAGVQPAAPRRRRHELLRCAAPTRRACRTSAT